MSLIEANRDPSRLFDYAALDAETRIVVQQKTGEIRERVKRVAQDLVEIGQRLSDVKGYLGHGNFGRWLEAEFEWSERTAQNIMNVAEAFKSAKFADLDFAPSALYLLSAPSVPEEVRQEATQQATNGHVSHKDARAIIDRYKPEPPPVRSEAKPAELWDDQPADEDESQDDDVEDKDEDEDAEDDEPEANDEGTEDEPEPEPEPRPVATSRPAPSVSPEPRQYKLQSADLDPPAFSKLWKDISDFLISLPRRGGISGLLKGYPRPVITGTHEDFLNLRTEINQAIRELEDIYPWLLDPAED